MLRTVFLRFKNVAPSPSHPQSSFTVVFHTFFFCTTGAFHDRSTTPDTLIIPILIKFGERDYLACQKHRSQSYIAEVNSFLVIAWDNFRGPTGN